MLWPPPIIDWQAAVNRSLAQLATSDWETFTETWAHLAMGWERGDQAHASAAIMRQTVDRELWLRFMAELLRTRDVPDFEGVSARIVAPTLVVQRARYPHFSDWAAPIPGSRTRTVPGEGQVPYIGDPRPTIDAIAEFVGLEHVEPTPAPARPPEKSGTAVILFTDIVDSTPLTERMGDAAFRAASRALDGRVRAAMLDCGGTPVEGKVLGDGVMGIFQSAAQAVAAARTCVELAQELPMHIGLHAGDVIREEGNVYGGAVNIASRICGLCAPGEILVSQTVRDLARTSAGVAFEDRGEHALKGIADPVRVFAVRSQH